MMVTIPFFNVEGIRKILISHAVENNFIVLGIVQKASHNELFSKDLVVACHLLKPAQKLGVELLLFPPAQPIRFLYVVVPFAGS